MTDKPDTPLTEQEHKARAMLMGRRYAKFAHSYHALGVEHRHICADTLEPLSSTEVLERIDGRMHRLAKNTDTGKEPSDDI